MDYVELLKKAYQEQIDIERDLDSKLVFIAENVFNFDVYDDDMAELFAKKALEVCLAINKAETYEYIKDKENYKWFLIMVNMSFFKGILDWGGSIRGAWWDHGTCFEVESCSIREVYGNKFIVGRDEWMSFVFAIEQFILED